VNGKDNKNKALNTLAAAMEARRNLLESTMKPVEVVLQSQKAAEQISKALRPLLQIQKMMDEICRPQKILADVVKQLKLPDYLSEVKKAMAGLHTDWVNQFRQTLDTSHIFKGIIASQQESQRKILEAIRPSVQIQKFFASEIAKINDWQEVFKSITDSIRGFSPIIETFNNALVIETEHFTQDQINQIADEYIWNVNRTKNIFKQSNTKSYWESLPKPLRWLIALIIGTIFTIYFTAIWKEASKGTILDPDGIAKHLIHLRKQEVKRIGKNSSNSVNSPFVNIEFLPVYVRPKHHSAIVVSLSYPCEIKILYLRNKKRWILIEWENGNGSKYQGWVLGRYIYRKNVQMK